MPLFNTDYDGNLRGSTWDIGALEYGSTSSSDTTFPVVQITNPTNNQTVSGSLVVTATASDNVGVVGVQFKLDGVNLGTEDTSSPYSINWNTLTIADGAHTLRAAARDAAGNVTNYDVSVTVNNAVSQPTPPTLIAAYAFNEGSGTISTDISGKGHVATLTGATWNNTGKYGNSLTFNGTSDYVSIADTNDLDFTSGMTLEAWVYPTSVSPNPTVILVKQHVYFLFGSYTGGFPMVGFASGGSNRLLSGVSSLPLNVWTHLAGTYDGSIMRLYVNGFEVANRPMTGTIDTTVNQMWIGSSVFNEFFPGRIDDVRVYNGALTQAAIQADMNTALSGGVPPTDTSLKLSYAFGEGSGGTTSDSSGNGHTGTISGASWTTSGKYGNALSFDGINDIVTSPDANDLDLTNAMTLEAWVFPTATLTSPAAVIAKEHVYFLYANLYNNLPHGGVRIGSTNYLASGTSPLQPNVWTHLAVTYDGTIVRLYSNGVQVSTLPATGSISVSANQLWIGSSVFNEFFPGRIDQVRIFNRALTLAEIVSNMNTAITAGQDIIPPIISSVTSGSVTSSSGRITWTTNELSNSQVEYGTTTTYGTSSILDASLATSHTVDLTGLSPSTLYHYRVKSKDPSNNLAMSSDATFTTSAASDVTPPNISGVGTSNTTSTSVSINWTTNEAGDSQVEYGPTTAYENGSTTLNTSLVTSHSVGLTGLIASTTYHYRVKSRDGAGNLATGSDSNFTTSSPPDTTAPIISSIMNSTPTTTGTTVSWLTNELSNSVVEYGITTSYGTTSSDSSSVLSHSVSLSGLSSGTLYHYRVKSTDPSGNLATSSDNTFTTQVTPDITPPVISNLQPSGIFPAGTTQVILSCITNELATVKYGDTLGTTYDLLPGTFSTTGGTTHSVVVTGLVDGTTYKYYIKARDVAGNANTGDLYVVTFSVSSAPPQQPHASIKVISPNGGENWKLGSTKQIQWSTISVTTNVKIELLRNGSYLTLFSNLSNTGSASWVVSGARDNHCKIRISTVDGTVTGSSPDFFKIT